MEDEMFESSELGDTCKGSKTCALWGIVIGGPIAGILGAAFGAAFGTSIHEYRIYKKKEELNDLRYAVQFDNYKL